MYKKLTVNNISLTCHLLAISMIYFLKVLQFYNLNYKT